MARATTSTSAGSARGEHNTQTGTGVVTYRDGVATFPGYFQEEPYYDIASVEVLRGPQGTFSGQNATGGAVIVNSQNPVIGGGYDGYLLAHFGNYTDGGLQGAVNLPISDTLAARFAINTDYRHSFYHIDGLTGDPNLKWASARLSLLWTPTSALTVLLKTDYNYLNNGGYFGDRDPEPCDGEGKSDQTTCLISATTTKPSLWINLFAAPSRSTTAPPAALRFRSVTGYQQGRTAWKGDIDGTNLPAPNYIISEKSDETLWSQEFNIISPRQQADNVDSRWILQQ